MLKRKRIELRNTEPFVGTIKWLGPSALDDTIGLYLVTDERSPDTPWTVTDNDILQTGRPHDAAGRNDVGDHDERDEPDACPEHGFPAAECPWCTKAQHAQREPRWIDSHSVNCIRCGKLVDERNCLPAPGFEGDICETCNEAVGS